MRLDEAIRQPPLWHEPQEDVVEMESMIVESLADLILLAPEADQPNLMAHAISAFGQMFLEKSGALEGGSNATH